MSSFMEWITGKDRQRRKDGIVEASASPAQAHGQLAEERASAWLVDHGLKILARNVCCRGGELDLVCLDGGTLVFVEVRLRTNPFFGCAAESITATKRRRIIFAAKWWLTGVGRVYQERPCRFDAVLFDGTAEPEWIRGAFEDR
ncbi:MAG: YraN family protein [Azoarcus sp.]|jgi:putative endonuclease|nr:YraN family protein [Azoarcus sp.]